jgi:hypothetical protein
LLPVKTQLQLLIFRVFPFSVLKDLEYSENHEWVSVEGDYATIGISDHAQVHI